VTKFLTLLQPSLMRTGVLNCHFCLHFPNKST